MTAGKIGLMLLSIAVILSGIALGGVSFVAIFLLVAMVEPSIACVGVIAAIAIFLAGCWLCKTGFANLKKSFQNKKG
jgi:hypothetical protein